MGMFKTIIIISCVVTFVLFGIICYLMTTVNPPPLPETKEVPKDDPLLAEFIRVTLGPQSTVNETKSALRDNATENYKNPLKYSLQRVVPPVWPITPNPLINKTVGSPENRALNETEKNNAESTTSTIYETLSVIKRSVNDVKQLGGDQNSIVLKIIDDSGQFNMEIKIGLYDAVVKENNETREDRIQSKHKSKYSISLKTKENDQFKKTKLAKNTIITVMPNDFFTVVEYDDHLEAQNKTNNNMIQASILDINNITKYNITKKKAKVMPIYRDVFKPIVIFYNQTKSIYHSDTKIEKRDLLEKPNDACNKTANNTTYNVTTQTEKRDKNTEKGDSLEKLNDVSDECKTNVNSFKTANNTAYNITTQTEKGNKKTEKRDLLEKPNDACNKNHNRFKTANNTTYNVTTQTEKRDKQTEKGDSLEKPNDVRDECKTNVSNFKKANNATYNVTTQTEKRDKKTEKRDSLEKPNDVSDECKTNVNSFKTANNTAYNITTQTEKGDKKTEKRDLLEKPNDACNKNHNSFKTAHNTTYNVTTQTEKRDKQTEKGDSLEKPNDVRDEYKTNASNSKKANNATYNVTTQTEKGDKKTEKGDLSEKPNDVRDECKTNVNSSKTAYNVTTQTEKANNTACNLIIPTEKATLQYYVVTTTNRNKTVEAENFTISTKTLDETSTIAEEVNSTIP